MDPTNATEFDLCVPHSRGAPTPAVLLIHGGGWAAGDKDGLASYCRYFSERGILAASVEYRLADGHAENGWPAQLVDVQLAVRWMRANANRLSIDPEHICAYGHSAGGQLAVWLAVEKSIHPGDYSGELPGASPTVSCAVDNFGPVEFTGIPRTYDWIIPLLFPDENETSRQRHAAELSPLLSIAGSTSPIFISHGIGDEVVPIAQSRALMSSLERSHVRAILVTFDGGHEFAGINPSTKDTILAQQLAFILQSAPNGMRQIAAASSP